MYNNNCYWHVFIYIYIQYIGIGIYIHYFCMHDLPYGSHVSSYDLIFESHQASKASKASKVSAPIALVFPGPGGCGGASFCWPNLSLTLWLFNIAMENDPFIDDFPIKTTIYNIYRGFSMAMLNNQMVSYSTQTGTSRTSSTGSPEERHSECIQDTQTHWTRSGSLSWSWEPNPCNK